MVLGAGMAGGTGVALAEEPAPPGLNLSEMDIGALLDNEMITQFVEMCRTGGLANGNPSAGTQWDPEDTTTGTLPPNAIASCQNSNGTGLALVLPDRFEVGQLGNTMVIDLGPDVDVYDPLLGWIKVVTLPMGQQNLLNLASGLIFEGNDILGNNVKSIAEKDYGVGIDPRMFSKYGDYETDIYNKIIEDAALEPLMVEERYCPGSVVFGACIGGWKYREVDQNLQRRADALKVAEFLTGQTYDYTKPHNLPPLTGPKGRSVIEGDGINIALSMRNGTAIAQTGNEFAVALAGADKGRLAHAYAQYGIAIAADMDLNDIRFTWFGQDVDFSNLLPLLQAEIAKEALGEEADEMAGMLSMLEGLNGQIPALKEVFCYGVNAKATAESFGSCSNFLGTFDTYKDLRPVSDGTDTFTGDSVSRQESQGIMDITSLIFGNDALLKSFLPMLSGGGDMDLGAMLSNPAIASLLTAALDEDRRFKMGKDFIRYTKNIETTFEKIQATDADGNLLWDPVYVEQQATNEDGHLLWLVGDEEVSVASGDEVPEGAEPKMELVNKQEQAKDPETGELLWNDAEQTDPMMVDARTPRMKNNVTARMVGVTEDAWETYLSNEPLMTTEEVEVQATDDDGNLLWTLDGADVTADEDGVPPAGASPKMVTVTQQVPQVDADNNPMYQEKTRYFKKPVMVEQTDADGKTVYRDATEADTDYVWMDADGQIVTGVDETDEASLEGLTKKAPVMVQKMEQAKDENGNLLWDPVVAKTVTAHWLTSDYSLREPLVIEWLGHQIVFFPAVELNDGSTRPNLIGAPQISKIVGDANAGLLPKINLVQWDNPLGLGTWSFDKPWDIFGTAKAFKKSITLDDDLKMLDKLVGPMVFPGSERLTDGLFEQLGLKKPKSPELPIDPVDPEIGEDDGIEAGDTGPETEGTGSTDPEMSPLMQGRPSAPAQTQDPASSSAPSTTQSAPSSTTAPSSPTVEDDPVVPSQPAEPEATVEPGSPAVPESSAVTPDPTVSVPTESAEVPSVPSQPQTAPAAPSEPVQSGQGEPVGAALIGG
ncbi:hypothetical protein GOHSU_08_00690 [Gordonia hirsuta DSM 44140 = NBRC 16056]|uniref:Uncharacterized protein n=2 Tax=Gordonia hirsuta TaxID=53427 RepID=L7L736_9ACTN|nr:hypothetical protein GOHSU_08_00690 [Gordonia hirsuta DSM 44140 = NBRC 16056]